MLVIDSSFLVAVLFEEEHTGFALERLSAVRDGGLVAPALLNWEIANVLRSKVIRNLITSEDALARLDAVAALLIVAPAQEAPPAVLLRRGLASGLTAYDAAYVELAVRLSAPLATLDEAMAKAAVAVGLTVHSPFA